MTERRGQPQTRLGVKCTGVLGLVVRAKLTNNITSLRAMIELLEPREASTFLPRSKQRHSELRVSDQLMQCKALPTSHQSRITNHFSPVQHARRLPVSSLSRCSGQASHPLPFASWRPWPTKLKGETGRSLLCVRFHSCPFAVPFLCSLHCYKSSSLIFARIRTERKISRKDAKPQR